MVTMRTLALGGFLLLVLCSVQGANFHDDDEDEVQDVAESVTPGTGPKTTSIQGYIANDQFLKLNKAKVIRVLIDDGAYSTVVRQDGSFQVHDVPEGPHFLIVVSPGWFFDSVRLEVVSKGSSVRVKAYTNNEMVRRTALPYPLQIAPASKLNYFVEREKFDPTSYLKNPMVLMVGLTMIMAFVMPKMAENMDEGEKAKIRDQYNKGDRILQGGAKEGDGK